jgi:predicted phosphate transport protein (TIGR00153 family)
MFAFKKNQKVKEMLEEYVGIAQEAVRHFKTAIEYLIDHNVDEHFELLAEEIHQFESNADDVRRQIELFLYEKSLLPETRRDLLLIIENIDRIPNQAQQIAYMYQTQRTEIFPEIKNELTELLNVSAETFDETAAATLDCFGCAAGIRQSAKKIDNLETLGDHLERKMITKVFASDLKLSEKILQKELIVAFGDICDLCEKVMDRIVICSVKRHV